MMRLLNTSTRLFLTPLIVIFLVSNAASQTQGWGRNDIGQLGIGNTISPQPNPVTVTAVPDAVAISGGFLHTVFLKGDGTVLAAGSNNKGQIGNGTTGGIVTTPTLVSGLTNVVQVVATDEHSSINRDYHLPRQSQLP